MSSGGTTNYWLAALTLLTVLKFIVLLNVHHEIVEVGEIVRQNRAAVFEVLKREQAQSDAARQADEVAKQVEGANEKLDKALEGFGQ